MRLSCIHHRPEESGEHRLLWRHVESFPQRIQSIQQARRHEVLHFRARHPYIGQPLRYPLIPEVRSRLQYARALRLPFKRAQYERVAMTAVRARLLQYQQYRRLAAMGGPRAFGNGWLTPMQQPWMPYRQRYLPGYRFARYSPPLRRAPRRVSLEEYHLRLARKKVR